jgi:hypothetical protein
LSDVNAFKREAQKPDGHLTFPGDGEYGKTFGFVPNNDLGQGQVELYLDAASRMDISGANAALQGTTEQSLSGKAIRSLQTGGMLELTPLFGVHSHWKKRVYRAVWNRVKQYWREERWIRVTDDEDNLQWVGLNAPMTVAEQNIKNQLNMPLNDLRQQFAAELQQMYQMQPELAEPVLENAVAEMDVDIVIEEVPDIVNVQAEQFEMLVQLYQANPQAIDFEKIIEVSPLRDKDKLLGRNLTPEQREALEAQQQQQQEMLALQVQASRAETAAKASKAKKDDADADAQLLENALVQAGFEGLAAGKIAEGAQKQADAALSAEKAVQTRIESELLITNPAPDKIAVI